LLPSVFAPGVVKVSDMGMGWRVPDAGSIQVAWVPGAIVEEFTEIVRWVGT